MIKYKVKNTFPLVMRVFGFIFIGFGLILILNGSGFGILPVVIGAVFGFTYEGVFFDLEKERFKEFVFILGFKKGKWISSKNYPYISLLSFNVQQAIYSLSNSKSITKSKVYRIYMLNESHFQKIMIGELKDEERALSFANQVVRDLDLELVSYSPQISAASRSRRR